MKLADLQPGEEYVVRPGDTWGPWSRMRMIEIRTVETQPFDHTFSRRSRGPRRERAALMERLQPDAYTVSIAHRTCQPDDEKLVIVPARHVRHTWAEHVKREADERRGAEEREQRERETHERIERLTETLGIPIRRPHSFGAQALVNLDDLDRLADRLAADAAGTPIADEHSARTSGEPARPDRPAHEAG